MRKARVLNDGTQKERSGTSERELHTAEACGWVAQKGGWTKRAGSQKCKAPVLPTKGPRFKPSHTREGLGKHCV